MPVSWVTTTPMALINWRLLLSVACFKIIYWTLLLLALYFWPDLDIDNFYIALQRWPREGPPTFASHLSTWDSAHYLFLSEEGYKSGEPSCAFYPLLPMLVKTFSWASGGINHLLAALLLCNVFSIIALACLHECISSRFERGIANWSVALLLAFPGALFFQFYYT